MSTKIIIALRKFYEPAVRRNLRRQNGHWSFIELNNTTTSIVAGNYKVATKLWKPTFGSPECLSFPDTPISAGRSE